MKTYETGNALKISEIDDYKEGCLPDTSQHMEVDISFQSDTIEGLISGIQEHFGVEKDSILINSCEEDGRIDIQTLENSAGHPALNREIESWKQGNTTLYACTYSYQVEMVTRETVKL